MKTFPIHSYTPIVSLLGALFLNSSVARANPVGETVAAGSVTFDRTSPGVLSIRQATDRAIINWQDFSIGAGELTRFMQPGANAAALNRVLGGNPSAIYGTLRANGQLLLLNPAGIIVGPSGRIDAKGFLASTLNISDDDFMSQARLSLTGASRAPVKNAGVVKAGNVYLVAREVENAGTIRASNAGLIAGNEVVLGDSGQGVAVLYGGSGARVSNSGLIEAAMAELRAAGDNPYALAINNSGIIRANTLTHEGGKIILKADQGTTLSNGTLDASGEKGGEVQVLGSRVGLTGSALVDVSGENGGGTALIGGDYQGKNPYVQNAARTFVGPNATIRADAKESGDGGKVIVWADELTRFNGTLSARGGAQGGDGGFAEISGKGTLSYAGSLDLGRNGSVLFDPRDIAIATGGTDNIAANDTFGEFPAVDVTFSPSSLVSALNGANVTLQANSDITISNDVVSSANAGSGNLTLRAGESITIGAGVAVDLKGSFTATAADTGADGVNDGNGTAAFSMGAGSTIKTSATGDNISITMSTGPTGVTAGGITLANLNAGSGHVSIVNNGAGSILAVDANMLVTASSATFQTAGGGTAKIGDTAGLAIRVRVSNLEAGSPTGNDTGGINIESPIVGQALEIGGANTDLPTTSNGIDSGGALKLTTSGPITDSEPVKAVATTLSSGSANSITLDNASTVSGAITITSANNFTLNNGGNAVNLGGGTVSGNLSITTTAGGISDSGATTVLGTTTLAANAANDITLDNANNFVGAVSITSGNNVALTDSNSILLAGSNSTISGTLDVTSTGAITQNSGSLSVTGGVATFDPGAGNVVSLNNAGNNFSTVAVKRGSDVTIYDGTGGVILGNVGDTAALSGRLTVRSIGAGDITQTATKAIAIAGTGAADFIVANGQSITLSEAGNNFANNLPLTFTAATGKPLNISINNNGATSAAVNLPTLDITGTLTVVNAGTTPAGITQSGVIKVGSTTSLTAGAGNITLGNTQNDFVGAVTIAAADTTGTVSLSDINSLSIVKAGTSGNGLTLGTVTAGTSLSVNTSGGTLPADKAITGTAVVTVGTATTFIAGTGAISLTNTGNDFVGDVTITSSGTLTLKDVNSLTILSPNQSLVLGGITATSLTVTMGSGLDLTDTGGTIAVTGTTSLTSAGSGVITLDEVTNDFGKVVVNSGSGTVTLKDANSIDFGASHPGGDLTVTSIAGNITQSGALTVDGNSAFTATAGSVTLGNTANTFTGTMAVAGAGLTGVTLADTTGLSLGVTTLSSGNLTLDTSGSGATVASIGQSGAFTVPGTATFKTSSGAASTITLTQANVFSGTVVLTSQNTGAVQVTGNTKVDFGTSTVGGTLTAIATAGNITQTGGVLNVTGAASFTANDAGTPDIILANTSNVFSGGVSVAGATLRDVSLASNSALTLGTVTVTGDLTVDVTGGGGGAGHLLDQSGVLTVGGLATFNNKGANNTLLNTQNNSLLKVTISSPGTGTVSIKDNDTVVNGLEFAGSSSTIGGDLNVTALGNITQTGELLITGNTSITATGKDVTLSDVANHFGGTVAITGKDVVVVDTDNLTFGLLTISGTSAFTVPANGSITLTNPNNALTGNVTFNAATGNLSSISVNDTTAFVIQAGLTLASGGSLSITTSGNASDITESTTVSVTDTGTLNLTVAGNSSITLGGANNLGIVSVTSADGAVSLTDSGAVALGASSLGAGFTLNAGGTITQTGPITVLGSTTISDATQTVTLTNPANNFVGAVGITATTASITDATSIVLATSTVPTLTVTATGPITQTGNLTVATLGTFAAGSANNITLDKAGNNFGTIAITNGKDVTITDTDAIILGNMNVSGTLSVTSGAITQTASTAISVTGPATFNTAGAAIALGTEANNFSTVIIPSGGAVALRDVTGIDIGTSSMTSLNVLANGVGAYNITQSGPLTITGASTFNTSAGTGSITLADSGNDFGSTAGTVGVTTGASGSASLRDKNALDLSTSSVGVNLTLKTGGDITQTGGALSVTGTTTINAPSSAAVTLANTANNFGTVVIESGGAVTLKDTSGIILGASVISGALDLEASVGSTGTITDTGNITVLGTTTLKNTTTGNIVLDNANDFVGAVTITAGNNVTLNDVSALSIGGASVITGDLTITTGGNISQTAKIEVKTPGSTATFTATAGDITLGNANNDFTKIVIGNGNNVSITDLATGIVFGAGTSTVGGTLSVTQTAGDITQTGALVVTGNAAFTTTQTGRDITLAHASNNFGGSVSFTSGGTLNSVTINDSTALELGTITVGAGGLTATTGGNNALTQSGILTSTGTASFNTGSGLITLDTQSNQLDDVVFTGGAVKIKDANGIDINGTSSASSLQITSVAGSITQDAGSLAVTGATTLTVAGGQSINIGQAGNSFGTVNFVASSGNIQNLTITRGNGGFDIVGPLTLGGTLSVNTSNANGSITQSGGALVVPSGTTLAAGGGSISLGNAANDLGGTVTVTSGNVVTINDGNALTVTTAGGITGSFVSTVAVGNLSFTDTGAAGTTTFGALTVSSGTLSITTSTSNRIIAGGGANVSVSGTTTLAAGTGNITLGSVGSNFGGTVTVTSGGVVTLNAGNPLAVTTSAGIGTRLASTVTGSTLSVTDTGVAGTLDLGPITATGLTVDTSTSGRNITQTGGAFTVSGTSTFDPGTGAITLTQAANNFGTVAVSRGGAIQITDGTTGLTLGPVGNTSPVTSLSVDTSAGAGSAILSGGAVKAGATTLKAGGASITLSDAANDFTGTVTITSGDVVTLNDASGLTVTTAGGITGKFVSTVAAGTLSVTDTAVTAGTLDLGAITAPTLTVTTSAGNRNITQTTGSLAVVGTSTFAAGTGAVTLTQAANNFGTIAVTSGGAVQITDNTGGLILGPVGNPTAVTSLNVNSTAAGGAITSGGAIKVSATGTTLSANGGDITLNDTANDFAGTVTISNGANVTLRDDNALTVTTGAGLTGWLAATTDAGTLDVTKAAGGALNLALVSVTGGNLVLNTSAAGGRAITSTGAGVTVNGAGTTSINATLADITLGGVANDFGGTVTILGGNVVTLNDQNALTITTAGNIATRLASTTVGTLSVTDTGGAGTLDFGAVSAANLNVTTSAGGRHITQTGGAFTVLGTSTFTAGTGNITLTQAANDFGTVAVASGNTVQITDGTTGLTLGPIGSVSSVGSLNVDTSAVGGGAIASGGAVKVTGLTTLAVKAANNIVLDNVLNDFGGTVTISSATDVTLKDANALTVTTGAGLTGTFAATTAAGTLDVTKSAGVALNLGLVSVTGGNLVLNTSAGGGRAITSSGAGVTVNGAGTTSINATAADITLGGVNNDFGGTVTILGGNVVTINDQTALTITTAGNIATRLASTTVGTLSVTDTGIAGGTLDFGAVSAANLNVTTSLNGRHITQTGGAFTVAGTSTFDAGTRDITLTQAANNFGTVAVTSGSAVQITDGTTGLVLGPVGNPTAVTSLNVNSTAPGGNITSGGAIKVSATGTTLSANGGAITLNNAANDFGGTVTVTSGTAVTIFDASGLTVTTSGGITGAFASTVTTGNLSVTDSLVGAGTLDLGAVTVSSGTLNVNTSAGNRNITQSGILTVSGTSTFNAGTGAVTLNTQNNDFTGAVLVTGGAATLKDINGGIILGTSTVTSLDVTTSTTAAGPRDITQNNPVTVTGGGTATFTSGSGAITLDTSVNDFGTVVATTTGAAKFQDANGIVLGAITANSLNVTGSATSAGAITQSGILTISGTTTLANGANAITLSNAGNDFTGAVTVTAGGAVTLTDKNGLALGAITTSGPGGDLIVTGSATAPGPISQSGVLSISGTATFANDANTIALSTQDNNFVGAVSVNSGVITPGAVSLKDATGGITLGTVKASSLTVDTVTGNGSITQNGVVTITGTGNATFSSGSGPITLNTQLNAFKTVTATSTGAVAFQNANALVLGTISAASLDVATTGAITQTGALTVTVGPTTMNSGVGANAITLDTQNNNFAGAVNLTGGAAKLKDTDGIVLGAINVASLTVDTFTGNGPITDAGTGVTVTGTATFTTGSGGINLNSPTQPGTVDNFGTVVATTTGPVTLTDSDGIILGPIAANSLSVTGSISGGAPITQNGILTITTTTTLANGANAITLNTQNNDFTGAVSVTSTGAVSLKDINGLVLGTVTANSLDVTGSATASGAITQTGVATVTTTTALANGANAITLDNVLNDFQGAVSVSAGGAVTLKDKNGLTLGPISAASLSLTGSGTTPGAIDGSGGAAILTITGTTALLNPGAAITLNNVGNDFQGAVSVAPGVTGTVTLKDKNALVLGAINAAGLDVTASGTTAGEITQTGVLTITGAAAFANGANAITLNTQNNDFQGAVSVTGTGAVSLKDVSGGIQFGTSSAASLNVDTVTLNGPVTQTGALTVTGTSTFTTGSGSITLNTLANNFGTVTATTTGTAAFQDSGAIVLGAISADGLTVTSNGAITQSGVLSVTSGPTTLNSGGENPITLDTQNNNFVGAVNLTTATTTLTAAPYGAVKLKDTVGGVLLGTVNVSSLTVDTVTGNGPITQNNVVTVSGIATFTSGDGAITLDTLSNSFGDVLVTGGYVVATTTGAVRLKDSGAISLGNISAVNGTAANGTLTVTASGKIDQSAGTKLTVSGAATINGAVGSDIIISNAGNSFGSLTITPATGLASVSITSGATVELPALDISGSLSVATTVGKISQTGAWKVGGTTTLTTSGAPDLAVSIDLPNTANRLGSSLTISSTYSVPTSAGSVTVFSTSPISLAGSTVNGALTLTAGGNISQTGSLIAGKTASFIASGGASIILDNAANSFAGRVSFDATSPGVLGNVTIVATTPVTLGALSLPPTMTGALSVTGSTIQLGTSGGGPDTIQSIGAQTYNGPVSLLSSVTVKSTSGSISFSSTIDSSTVSTANAIGEQGLTIDAAGSITLGGNIGASKNLTDLITKTGGQSLILPASIRAVTVNFQNPVTLSAASTTVNGTTSVTFGNTVDGSALEKSLTVNSPVTSFKGVVGGLFALGDLVTDVSGTTDTTTLNTGTINAATVDFKDRIVLTTATTIAAIGHAVASTSSVSIGGITDTGHDLTLSATGTTAPANTQAITLSGQATGLGSLAATATTINLKGGVVTTAGPQTYTGTTKIYVDTTLTGSNIHFTDTVDADDATKNRSFTVTSSSLTSLDKSVGAGVKFGTITLNGSGSTALGTGAASTITLNAPTQNYSQSIQLGYDTTFSGDNLTFSGARIDSTGGARALTLNTGSAGVLTTINSKIGVGPDLILGTGDDAAAAISTLTTSTGGKLILSKDINSTGAQTYNTEVVLAGDVTLVSAVGAGSDAIIFAKALNSDATTTPRSLTVKAATGDLRLKTAVGATAKLSALIKDSGASAADGNTYLEGASVNATTQNYGDTLQLKLDTTLTGHDVTLAAVKTITVPATTDKSLTVSADGVTRFNGTVSGINKLTVSAEGTAEINTASITTSGDQTFTDDLTLWTSTALSAAVTKNIAISVGKVDAHTDGGQSLTIDPGTTGTITLSGNIGNTAASKLSSLALNKGPVTIKNSLTFGATGAVTVEGKLDPDAVDTRSLTVNAGGLTWFKAELGSAKRLLSLSTDLGGGSQLDKNVTAITQNYQDDVTAGGNLILAARTGTETGGTVTFGGTLSTGGNATRTLTINAGNDTTFTGAVGTGTPFLSLTTDGGTGTGGVKVYGGSLSALTLDLQEPNGVTIYADTTLSGTTKLTVAGPLNADAAGTRSLTINSAGLATLGGVVGGVGGASSLVTFTTNNGGGAGTTESTLLKGSVSATTQNYNDDIQIGGNLTLSGTTITFNKSVMGDANNTRNLTISAAGGAIDFKDKVGARGTTTAAFSLLDTTGPVTVEGGSVAATTQAYHNNVVVTATTAFTGAATFTGTLNENGVGGARDVTFSSTVVFNSSVGDTAKLRKLTTGTGLATVKSDITASDTISFAGDVQMVPPALANNTITLTAPTVKFDKKLDATTTGLNLLVNASGTTTFTGNVGDTQKPLNLSTDSSGTTAIVGNVKTAHNLAINDSVQLKGTSTLFADAALDLLGTVNGDTALTRSLTLEVNGGANIQIASAIGNTQKLVTFTSGDTAGNGTTHLRNGSITATTQIFKNAVSLEANTTLSGATTVTFSSNPAIKVLADSVTQQRQLVINATGVTTLGTIGNDDETSATGKNLGSVLTDATGSAILTGSIYATTQRYRGTVTVDAATAAGNLVTLKGTTVNFEKAVNAKVNYTYDFLSSEGSKPLVVGKTVSLVNGYANGGDGKAVYRYIGTAGTFDLSSENYGNAARWTKTLVGDELTVTASGDTTFSSTIGGSQRFYDLKLNGGGRTILTGDIKAFGITVSDDVVLAANVVVTASGTVTFSGTVDGDVENLRTLTLNSASTPSYTFSSAVGGSKSLLALSGDASATVTFSNPTVRATTFNIKGTLNQGGASGTYTGTTVTLGNLTINSGDLTVTSTGAVTIGNVTVVNGKATVSGTTVTTGNLTLSAAGDATITGTGVVTMGNLSLNNGNATVTGTTVTLGDVTLSGAGKVLTIPGTTTVITLGGVGPTALSTSNGALTLSGPTQLKGSVSTGTGAQAYNNTLDITGTVTLTTTGGVTFGGAVNAKTANSGILNVNSGGTIAFPAGLGATRALAQFSTTATGMNLTGNLGANIFDLDASNTTLNMLSDVVVTSSTTAKFDAITGNTHSLTVNGASTTTFTQTPAGIVNLATDATGTVGGTTTFTLGTINPSGTVSIKDTLSQTTATTVTGTTTTLGVVNVTGGGLTVNGTTGGITLAGNVTTTANTQTYNHAVNITGTVTLAGSGVTFANAVNATTANTGVLTINAGAALTFPAGLGATRTLTSFTTDATTINLTGNLGVNTFNFTGKTLATTTDVIVTAGTSATFGTITGGHNLTVNGGNAVFTTDPTGVVNLATDASGAVSGTTTFNTGNINPTGTIAIKDTLQQSVGTTISGTTVTLGVVNVTGTNPLVVNGTTGGINLTGNVTTTGATQTYNHAVDITGTVNLTGTDVTFLAAVDAKTANTGSLTITAPGATIDIPSLGATRALASFTATASAVHVNGDFRAITSVSSSGDTTVLGATVTLGTVNITGSGKFLNITGTSAITLGAVTTSGGIVTVNNPVNLTGSVNTGAASQTYGGAVDISGAVTLTASGVTFNPGVAVNAKTANSGTLTINTPTAAVAFGAGLGATRALSSFSATSTGVTVTGAANVTTSVSANSDLTVNPSAATVTLGTVSLTGATSDLAITGGSASITTGAVTTAGGNVTLNSSGANVTAGAITTSNGTVALTAGGASPTITLSGSVSTGTGQQTYAGGVDVSGTITLSSTHASGVSFGSNAVNAKTANGGSLTINTANAAVTFNAGLGATRALSSFTATAPSVSVTAGNANVTTSVSISGSASLTGATTATLGSVSITGAGSNLTVNESGAVTISSLSIKDGDVSLTGGSVTLGAVTVTTPGTTDLTVSSAGLKRLTGNIGTSTARLTTITVAGGGTLEFGANTAGATPALSIFTTGAQNYQGVTTVSLNKNTTLTANSTATITGPGGGQLTGGVNATLNGKTLTLAQP